MMVIMQIMTMMVMKVRVVTMITVGTHGIEESEAGVRQVVDQDHLEWMGILSPPRTPIIRIKIDSRIYCYRDDLVSLKSQPAVTS